jgi:cytochrome P450
LHADRIAAYGDLVVAAAQRMLSTWPTGEARDLQAAMLRLTLEIMARALFAVEVADDSDAMGTALMTAIEAFIARMGSVLLPPERIPTPGNVRLRREVRRLNDLVYRLISQRRSSGAGGSDLLSQLLRAQDEDGRRMTDRQVRDEVLTLFLGGHDTTAITLSWIWRLLGQHPEVEAAVVAELQEVLDGRMPTVADLPRLRYTQTIVYETLRLYPRVYVLGREARQDCAIGGYRVPAGTTVLMSPWGMHRDPRYFERPEEFTPERWAGGLARGLPEYVYFPFGAGPRRCVGGAFAMMEAVLLVATIAHQARLRLVPGPAHVLRSGPTLRPHDAVQVTLQRR